MLYTKKCRESIATALTLRELEVLQLLCIIELLKKRNVTICSFQSQILLFL